MQNMRSNTKTNVHRPVCVVTTLASLMLVLSGRGQKEQRLDQSKAGSRRDRILHKDRALKHLTSDVKKLLTGRSPCAS
jgi:hypothetical protein